MSNIGKWFNPLTRRKTNAFEDEPDEKLARVLGLLDLSFLGIGSTLGLGVYVLAGEVALEAGPAVTVSFLIAAIASAFAGLCFAELASRVPKAGSAYVYCYVTIGEFAAFVIGWNLILEYTIGTAAVAKALSKSVDHYANNYINHALTDILPMNMFFMAPYVDLFAFGLVTTPTALLALGAKESSIVNNVLTLVNILTVLTVIIAGIFKANASYWAISKENIPTGGIKGNFGQGGFFPFGWDGVLKGAAKCFFGYVGFDVIATTGEEAKNPKRNIPLALVISLVVIFLAYFGIATVITMLIPYYNQDKDASLIIAFNDKLPIIAVIVGIGAISALSASLLGAIFPLPRILYSMACDGLLFSCFTYVNNFTKTPLIATVISGLLSGIFAAVFDLEALTQLMSLGTLLAYSIVALCILIMRYKVEETEVHGPPNSSPRNRNSKSRSSHYWSTLKSFGNRNPTAGSEKMTQWLLLLSTIFISMLCFTLVNGNIYFSHGSVLFYGLIIVLSILCILCFIIICLLPQNDTFVSFKVPLVPLVPICSIFMNIYLMMTFQWITWVKFIIWLILGLAIYFFYSLKHSLEGNARRNVQTNGYDEIPLNENGQICDSTQL